MKLIKSRGCAWTFGIGINIAYWLSVSRFKRSSDGRRITSAVKLTASLQCLFLSKFLQKTWRLDSILVCVFKRFFHVCTASICLLSEWEGEREREWVREIERECVREWEWEKVYASVSESKREWERNRELEKESEREWEWKRVWERVWVRGRKRGSLCERERQFVSENVC